LSVESRLTSFQGTCSSAPISSLGLWYLHQAKLTPLCTDCILGDQLDAHRCFELETPAR
ncbi:hypothetical protein P7K49_020025, partial [Saguinus oedipus]